MRQFQFILPLFAGPLLSGCVVKTVAETAVDVVTLPVKVASAGVDAATTSQSEADEKRGREMRKQEEHLGKARRKCDAAREDGHYDEKWCPIAEGRD